MIPAWRWRRSMLRYFEPSGPYSTKALAHYPLQMNDVLAETWVRAVVAARIPVTQATSMARTGRWANTLIAAHLLHPTSNAQPVGEGGMSQPACNGPPHVPELDTAVTHCVGHIGDKVTHITGLPKVTQPLPLKLNHPPLGAAAWCGHLHRGAGGHLEERAAHSWPQTCGHSHFHIDGQLL